MAKEGLYSIGKVSKICDVSPRTLRYYEEVGLLQPDRINEHSGYRYYSAESMYQVQVIRYLSDEGFSLEEIGQILHEEDLVKLREIFAGKIASTRRTIDYYHRREESLKAWYELFVEGEWVLRHGGLSPAARYIPRERYLCYRCRYDGTEKSAAYIEANYKTFSKLGGRAMVDVGGAVYVRFDSFQARMEGQPTQMAFLEHMQPGSRQREETILLGGFTAVTGYHLGALEQVRETYAALLEWAARHGFTLRGDVFERRVIDSYSTSLQEHFVTELLLPVEEDVSGFLEELMEEAAEEADGKLREFDAT